MEIHITPKNLKETVARFDRIFEQKRKETKKLRKKMTAKNHEAIVYTLSFDIVVRTCDYPEVYSYIKNKSEHLWVRPEPVVTSNPGYKYMRAYAFV